MATPEPANSSPSAPLSALDLTNDALRAFHLAEVDIVRPSITGQLGSPIRVAFHVGATPMAIDLYPHSVRADDFQLFEQQDDGSLLAVPAPEPRTYRGSVVGDPAAIVAASWLDDGVYARIHKADGSDLWLQPMASHVEGADALSHVLYHGDNVLEVPFACGVDADSSFAPPMTGDSGPAAISVCDIACDADYEYYKDYGQSSANVQNRIDSVVNTMNLQYESEVSISHNINMTLVRASKQSNPYKSKSASRLLDIQRNDWENNHDGVDRDTTHLFTGIPVAGGTIGIAYVGVICHDSYAYGLVQSDFNNNFSCATDLSAHELGHNWNAPHCSCTSHTMNPYITCANTFSSGSRAVIAGHRDSRNCLE
ncbi:MAG: M12 family metallo-peptidase [Planctomycetota bacterium]|nr:M12 family metallo-peptidase [Planctomycetota bacterium]